MWIQIAAVVLEVVSLVFGWWTAIAYFRMRARCTRLEESERHLRDRVVDAETRHDRLQDEVTALREEVSRAELERDEYAKFVIICSDCREPVPPGMLYTTQYPRDSDGCMTSSDPTYTCEACERRQQGTDSEPEYPDAYPWEDSTMDELNSVCDWCGEPQHEHHAVCASEAERSEQR